MAILNFIVFVLLFLPITAYIFRRFKLNLLELILLTLILSTAFLPIISWLFNLILPFGYLNLILSILLPLGVSGYLLYSKKVVPDDFRNPISKPSLVIFLLFVGAVGIHLFSLTSFFYEFDPYYYSFMNYYLLKDGFIPSSTNLVYVPPTYITHGDMFQPTHPVGFKQLFVPQYLGALWYLIGFGNSNVDHFLVKYVADLYPPLAFGLMVFAAYFLLRDKYSPWIAVSTAFILMFMPYLSQKFLAGVSEQLPWGLYIGLASTAMLYYGLRYGGKDKLLYIPAIITSLAALLGSKAGMIPYVIAFAYSLVFTTVEFFFNRRHKSTYELPAILSIVSMVFYAIYSIWVGSSLSLRSYVPTLLPLFGAIFSYLVYHLMVKFSSRLKTYRERGLTLGAIGLFVILFMLSPLGSPMTSYLMSISKVGTLADTNALQKTVAEESLSGFSLESKLGMSGIDMPITGLSQKLFGKYGALDRLPIVYILLVVIAIVSLTVKSDSSLLIISSLLVLSLSFVGLQKVKYLPHLGGVLALSFGIVAGEFYLLFSRKEQFIKPNSWQYYLLYGVGVLLVLIYGVYPFISYLIGTIDFFMGKGSVDMFQIPNTAGYILMAFSLILIGYGVYYFGYKSTNRRYDISLALILLLVSLPISLNYTSLLPNAPAFITLEGTNYTAVQEFCSTNFQDPGLSYAARFTCSVMPPYWYDAMSWLRDNMDNESYLLSWWDYGHWTNFYAHKRTVTRNDHPFVLLDLEVADKYVANTPEALAEYMRSRNSTYVLFDIDLIGKWGALTYLSCVYNGETSSSELPSESQCAAEHMFERVIVPAYDDLNVMCEVNGNYGRLGLGTPGGRKYCILPAGNSYLVFDPNTRAQLPIYLVPQGQQTISGKPYLVFMSLYTEDHLDMAPTKGYNSVFYKAFVLGDLPGFEQVYPTDKSGLGVYPIRIYKRLN